MTTPHEEQPRTEVAATPSVTTAPPRARWRFANVPSRLGRARTSTVVLAVLFVAVFVLWVYVRPDTTAATTGSTSGVTGGPPAPAATSSAAPTTSEAPTTTEPTTTTPSGTTTESSTPTDETTTGATTTTPRTSSSTSTRSSTSVSVPSATVPTSAP